MKKIHFLLINLTVVMVFSLLSCAKDQNDRDFPVDFHLQLLNLEGEDSTVFKEGDTIAFRLELTNTTNEKVYLTNFMPDLVCKPENDFFRIYQESPVQKDRGRVCMPSNCTYEGLFLIEANQTRVLEYTWPSNNIGCSADMPYLSKGTYRTGFVHIFEANGKYRGLSSSQAFSTTFKIE